MTFACLGSLLAATMAAPPAHADGMAAHRAAAPLRRTHHVVRHAARRHRSINYGWAPRVPRWDPVEVQAEVHTFYPIRTPFPYPGLYWW